MANRKPSLSYFHVFGAKCYVLKEEHLGKLDSKAEEGIVLGYSLESKAYRVYLINDDKLIESINVRFDDTKLPSLQKENESDSLEFENLDDIYIGEDEPEADTREPNATERIADPEPSGGSVGNNTNDHHDHSGQSGGSSNRISISSGGASHISGSTSRHTQHNNDYGESSRLNLPRPRVWSRDHPIEQIIGDPDTGVQTRRATQNECNFAGFLSQTEPKKVEEALNDPDWISAMQEELIQFERQKVCQDLKENL